MNQQLILHAYLTAATFFDAEEEHMTKNATIEEYDPQSVEQAKEDIQSFVAMNQNLLEQSGQTPEQIGHDFWLTRQGHGAGFWDRGLGKIGDQLTENIKNHFKEKFVEYENGIYFIH
jgi:hypothetical protein